MVNITVEAKRLQGRIFSAPDKSISHRAVIIGSLAEGETEVKNLAVCDDCWRTVNALRLMGVSITRKKDYFFIQGRGLNGLHKPERRLYLGNSGTTMRLLLGVLAGQKFNCVLSGDASLSRRPMQRVIEPLSLMGAKITSKRDAGFAPLTIQGGSLSAISYKLRVASAQVKSAVLLAGLFAEGKTQVEQPAQTRDHTEKMLRKFGAQINSRGSTIVLKGRTKLTARNLEVPGDISAASFFLVGSCIAKNSQLTVQSVGLNPTRTAFLDLLKKMGAELSLRYRNSQMAAADYADEAVGQVMAKYSQLKAITIRPQQIPLLIDELPILMVAATQAAGTTVIQQASELRIKESDRIAAMVFNLAKMGAEIKSCKDDVIIRGPTKLVGCSVESFHDHRIAMSMAIAALAARGRTTIKNIDCVKISFPEFFKTLAKVAR